MVLPLNDVLDYRAEKFGEHGYDDGVEEDREDDPPALRLNVVFIKLDDVDELDARDSCNDSQGRKENDDA
eukprot:CAMPEP_0185572044 /NCGR_PEP_ID=MMETSP0434-20130131/4035_1 /TAXON_ID=626734 ORGANISM="Favella taraikaensis, Strain Fe Narragansett Bay" /NCGR_SAMPLE_ID=MMETSP0434 /ASSEMBLY_ACC=CAM_ASM_000379 /LENGTH=69 /DNA_ID=CAMNT_0028187747 /DNA_START=1327 /DNA_END=1536 /DNA_ORIENTATION=+